MIKINKDLCIGCGACVGVCPTGSLNLDESGHCECNNETCIQCLACISTCPVEAISDEEEVEKEEPKETNIEKTNLEYYPYEEEYSKRDELMDRFEEVCGSDREYYRDFVENLEEEYLDDWLENL